MNRTEHKNEHTAKDTMSIPDKLHFILYNTSEYVVSNV